jgi:hypothetical protein
MIHQSIIPCLSTLHQLRGDDTERGGLGDGAHEVTLALEIDDTVVGVASENGK